MRISELRASHLAQLGDTVNIVRNDGAAFTVVRTTWDDGDYYEVSASNAHATFGDADGSGTSTTLRGVAALIRDAVIVGQAKGDITDAMYARVSIQNRANDAKVALTAREFLATRIAVSGVCAALGVTPDDGAVQECLDSDGNATADLPGWTYVDGWGSVVYIVQYADGKIGAAFGNQEVYADTLDLAELQLFALLCEPTLEKLSELYVDWCQARDLPMVCAEELIFEELTDEQRAWVSAFIGIWERAE